MLLTVGIAPIQVDPQASETSNKFDTVKSPTHTEKCEILSRDKSQQKLRSDSKASQAEGKGTPLHLESLPTEDCGDQVIHSKPGTKENFIFHTLGHLGTRK